MADMDPRLQKALDDACERFASHFAQLARSFDGAAVALDNLRLAIPTEDVRIARQEATNVLDRIMRN